MFSINALTRASVLHQPLPPPADYQGDPFCEGFFMEDLPRFPPSAQSSWCGIFSQCMGFAGDVESASATAHRQLLALLARLPDRVPGNAGLQAQIDRLQLAVGSYSLGRHPARDKHMVLEKLIAFSVDARNIECRLTADYRLRWQPAHAQRPRAFEQLPDVPRSDRAFQALL